MCICSDIDVHYLFLTPQLHYYLKFGNFTLTGPVERLNPRCTREIQGSRGIDAQLQESRDAGVACVRV